jgi:hypothetical protein
MAEGTIKIIRPSGITGVITKTSDLLEIRFVEPALVEKDIKLGDKVDFHEVSDPDLGKIATELVKLN